MLHHCRAVARAVKSAFVVGDLPMGSYEVSPEQAITSSIRMIQEGRVQVSCPIQPCPGRSGSLTGWLAAGGKV